jgi:hypothetical protein
MPKLPSIDWTLTNALVTLALLIIPILLLWLRYRVARTQAGIRKPILVRRARPIAQHRFGDEARWDRFDDGERDRRRLTRVYVYNQSDIAQQLMVNPHKSRVLWPPFRVRLFAEARELNLGPHEGGNVDLVVANGTFGWPEKLDRPNRVHWLWLRGETRSRRNVRRLLPVRLRPLRKVVANPDGTLTVTDTLINTFGQ